MRNLPGESSQQGKDKTLVEALCVMREREKYTAEMEITKSFQENRSSLTWVQNIHSVSC